MPMNRFALSLSGLALTALPALAQAPPSSSPVSPTASPNTSSFMTDMKAGMWRAIKLDGLDVYNRGNEKIGDISELILDQSGKVSTGSYSRRSFLRWRS